MEDEEKLKLETSSMISYSNFKSLARNLKNDFFFMKQRYSGNLEES